MLKCQVIQVTGSRKHINANYSIHGQVLETATCARYLGGGGDISTDLSWNSHIDRITGKATKTLNFVRRNIRTKHPGVREMIYNKLSGRNWNMLLPYGIVIQKTSLNRLKRCSVELQDGFPATM